MSDFQIFMTLLISVRYISRGIDCIDDTTILAFTHTDPGSYGNRAVKNETVILHTDSGELTKLLSVKSIQIICMKMNKGEKDF